MLKVAYWVTLVIWLIILIARHKKSHIYGINSLMLIGVVMPLLLYLADYSVLIDTDIDSNFYYIFIAINLIMSLYSMFADETLPASVELNIANVSIEHAETISLVFLALYVVETYLLSGLLAPALHGKDIHTASFPIISFLTRNIMIPAMLDVICFYKTRKYRYLVYVAVIIFLPIVTRNARMVSFETIMAVLLLWVILHAVKQKHIKAGFLNVKVKHLVAVACVCILAVGVLNYTTELTNKRTINNGAVDFDYGESIGYTGPLGNIGAVYYGYFPLSYNNLNLRLKYDSPNYNPEGLYSFASLWFGVLELDNIFGISTTQDVANRIVTTSSATVPTAFWTYWYDYGPLGFFPVVVMICTSYYALMRCRNNPTVLNLLLYTYLAYKIFFESFQNIYFAAPALWGLIILAIIDRFCILPTSKAETYE